MQKLYNSFVSTKLIFALLVGLFLLLLPFQVWKGLFFAIQTSKVLFLGWGVVAFAIIGGGYCLLNGRARKLAFTTTDLLLGLLLFFAVVHAIWIRPVQLNPLFVLQWLALVTLYIVFRRLEAHYRLLLMIFVMIAGAAQAIYGNLQLYEIYPSYHNLFKLTGSFFNPGPYSGYLISVLPVAVGLYLNKSSNVRLFEYSPSNNQTTWLLNSFFVSVVSIVRRVSVVLNVRNNRNIVDTKDLSNPSNPQTAKPHPSGDLTNPLNPSTLAAIIRIIAITTIISIVLVLPAGGSRAAWLAGAISVLYLLAANEKVLGLWHQLVGTGRRKWLLYTLFTFIVLAVISGLYLMKKGSADGRVLIWKVTLGAIKEQPVWGHGIEKFRAFYMDDQAGYFKDHPETSETEVAGDNNYAFNEPLRITSETGMTGLALVLLVIWSLFWNVKSGNRKKEDPDNLILLSRAGLLSVFVFGLFSYPAEIVPIMVNFFLFLAVIAGSQQPIITIPIGVIQRNPFARLIPGMAVVIAAILASQQLFRINHAYTQWNEAFTVYSMGMYKEATDEYEKTYPFLKDNGDYLINCGKALSMAGKHEKAIEILEQSKPFLTNTILYTALGDSYKATGQPTKAEAAYLHAWYMVPSRFYPKYLLAKLYVETGQHEKAVAIAKELLRKEVKIESTAVKQILEEMRKIIEKQ